MEIYTNPKYSAAKIGKILIRSLKTRIFNNRHHKHAAKQAMQSP